MNFETIAEKVIPTLILAVIGALFSLYMDVAHLKEIASDYKQRADEAHKKYERQLEYNSRNVIIQKEQLKYFEDRLSNCKDK